MSAHTPGPWTTDLPKCATIREKATRKVIATLGFNVAVGSTEDDDNATLIASAPELLAALRGIVDANDAAEEGGSMDALHYACRAARAAIARAEGRQS